jgi:urea carboxylase-associated protein 1
MTHNDSALGRVERDDTIPAGASWNAIVEAGAHLRVVDLEGRQGVDFLCYNADELGERYNAPNTVKAAGTIAIGPGTVLYSDYARPMMTVAADSCGGHDTIRGCCSAWSNAMLYGVEDVPGCRENLLAAIEPHGLGWRDLVPNINFFCSVPVHTDGRLSPGVFVPGHSKPGDYVDLRAEMRTLVAISNCPQINNPCNDGAPTPIRIIVHRP